MLNKLNCAFNWVRGLALGFDILDDYRTLVVYCGIIEVILYWGDPADFLFTDMIFNPEKYEEAHYETENTKDKDSSN